MKQLLLLFLLSFGSVPGAAAQNRITPAPGLPADSLGRIQFTGVVAVPGVAAAELQARAREWVALTFQDARQVTQLDDAARGVLIVRGYTNMNADPSAKGPGPDVPLGFTLRLDMREGRYRYELRDLSMALHASGPFASRLDGTNDQASQQAYDAAAWLTGATATVEASQRQRLLQPAYSANPADYNVLVSAGRRWPQISAGISRSVTQLLESLRRHQTAPPQKW